LKVPAALQSVGHASFDISTWRDVKEYLVYLDVWNLFCSVLCGAFRVVLENNESLSLGGSEMARLLRDAADARLVGHSDITTSLSRWHASFVLDSPTALWANLSSVALRDRAIRPAIMLAINPGAKSFLRSTFPRDDGLFVTFLTELHSWRFKEENAWRALYALDEKLACQQKTI
jgi:hypothetical protein